MAYRKDQWIESFEGQLSILRAHLTPRVLSMISGAAWQKHGTKGLDPIKAAQQESALIDEEQAKRSK